MDRSPTEGPDDTQEHREPEDRGSKEDRDLISEVLCLELRVDRNPDRTCEGGTNDNNPGDDCPAERVSEEEKAQSEFSPNIDTSVALTIDCSCQRKCWRK